MFPNTMEELLQIPVNVNKTTPEPEKVTPVLLPASQQKLAQLVQHFEQRRHK